MDTIAPGKRAGGRAVAEHLARLGHTEVGVVCGPLTPVSVREGPRGFLERAAEPGIAVGERHRGEADSEPASDARRRVRRRVSPWPGRPSRICWSVRSPTGPPGRGAARPEGDGVRLRLRPFRILAPRLTPGGRA